MSSVASHLGIRLRDYDARIRTFIPAYEEMLDAAAAALRAMIRTPDPAIVDLGTGSGALAARSLRAVPGARVIGIDTDRGMLGLARRRLGDALTPIVDDFSRAALPRCDAITASFALHHVRTRARKAALYRRAYAALRPRGLVVNADCCPASDARLQGADRLAWRAHLERRYTRARAEGFLRAWAKEDVYVTLEDEIALLRGAGFRVDVTWRRASFAVLVAIKDGRRVRQ